MSHGIGLAPRTENRFPGGGYTSDDELFLTSEGPALRDAIDELYTVFCTSKLDPVFDGCRHCFTEADIAYLRNTPLRELTLGDAAFLLADCPNTLGEKKDINYFLPRVLEAWAYRTPFLDHVIPDRLLLARDAGWTGDQTAAVARFVTTLVAAINELSWNAVWWYDMADYIVRLKSAVPEAGPVRLILRDSNAETNGEIAE